MSKIFVFGHKNPDTDAIASAISMAYLQTKLGLPAEPRRLGTVSKETKYALDYFKIGEPDFLERVEDGQEVILTDHNEPGQSVENIKNATISMVVDHHRIDGISTAEPLYYYAEPVRMHMYSFI